VLALIGNSITFPIGHIARHAPELAEKLKPLLGRRHARIVSVPRGPNGNWRRLWSFLSAGDLILYTGGGRVFGAADILLTGQSAPLGKAIEPDSEYGPVQYFMFLSAPRACDISYDDFNRAASYKPNFIIQGFSVLSGERTEGVMKAFPRLRSKGQLARAMR
jgi:hypothetical protein